MKRTTELDLIKSILRLKEENSPHLDETATRHAITRYVNAERFEKEQTYIFAARPKALAHVSEIPNPHDFVIRQMAGRSVLITRDKEGHVYAFHNVCRHRGSQLVSDPSGCKKRFSCPYHAWTYDSAGALIAAPYFDEGFPEFKKSELGLKRLACAEKHGFIWVGLDRDKSVDLEIHFSGLGEELQALNIADMEIVAEDIQIREANWKIIVEGGIESYHFKVAHKKTIGPYFEDNLSTYKSFGPHMRSVLPRSTIASLSEQSEDAWRLRDHANILYTVFPSCQLLVQQDHIVWISSEPLSAGKTKLRLCTLVDKATEMSEDYWQKNHDITIHTLNEDFDIGENIQANFESGAVEHILFGRFEGALDSFNTVIDNSLKIK